MLAAISAMMTVELFTFSWAPFLLTVTVLPSSILTFAGRCNALSRAALTLAPLMTWYLRMRASCAMFAGFNKSVTVPAGSLANAASVGAKTVNGPLPFKAVAKLAAESAATSVLKPPLAMAVSTMSL